MFKVCELAAIIAKDTEKKLRYIPLSRNLQQIIKEQWECQYNSFFNAVEEIINFNPDYKLDKHQLFCLPEYELPNWLAAEDGASISDFDPIRDNERHLKLTKGIAAFIESEIDEEFVLFQRFKPSQVIRTSLSAIWDLDTFRKMEGAHIHVCKFFKCCLSAIRKETTIS